MRIVVAACMAVFLACIIALPVIDYLGGRRCMPLTCGLWPAAILPFGIGLLAVVILIGPTIRSLIVRRHRLWTLGALAVVAIAAWAYWSYASQLPGFLEGLRDRFVTKVGYPTMREFAREVLRFEQDAVAHGSDRSSSTSEERRKYWDILVSRYPFMNWAYGPGHLHVRDGVVQVDWGSPLTGHWGFQVSPEGAVKAIEEDEGRILRVADDIQFVYYCD